MSTADERYELARSATDKMVDLAETFNQIGIYGEDEFKAAATLLMSLSRAMTILDPDKAKEYRESVLAQHGLGKAPGGIDFAGGQYL
ncbi:hypothetical protein SEA_BILLNYE_80 [Streptomyces phage BillNye]|uniref:Uncharacterized protein n=2 Tax=Wilnyevirus billnye TaxID=2560486 RepID=A0A2L1IVR8_9CAUD|nr:hypothetical protein FDJ30_gp151 [Streptomyces phage BillNye]AVD99282.1 hypothetical protein SEA_BILLNYE_80 [Streptomyces phage BillNye]QBZ72365.1 hypothetical protein SEA_CIRCINUS_81 [Streptomyces phage Circinus]